MGAYEMTELVLAGLVFLLGVIMVLCPKACTKKALRDDPEAVARVRKSGIIEMVVGVLLVILFFI